MNADTLLENFEILAEAPGGIVRLREVILGLAAQGKLFRDTDLTKWQLDVTLKDFGRMIRGITYAKAESSKEPTPNFVPLLGAANIQRSINYEGLTFVASSLIKPDQYLKDGDVLICMSSGSKHLVGKAGIVRNPPASSFGAFCGVFRISDEKNRDYLAMLFKSPMYRTAISVASRGIGINNLRVGDIESIAFSLPPLAEQKRIVAKVDELMALCDQLEQQQQQRDNLRTATRKSAIDAISTATTAEELETAWKRINNNWDVIADTPESVESLRGLILGLAVTDRLVESSNSQLSEHVMSFESPTNIWATFSPKGWKCLSLEDASDQITDGTHQTPNYVETGVPFLSIKDISSGKLDFSRTRFISPKEHKKLTERVKPQRGDVLICRIGTLGRAISVDTDEEFSIFVSLGLVRPKEFVNPKFLAMLLNSPISYQQFDAIKAGGSHTVKLNLGSLRKYVLWIPSMEVQELILSKVDELMALCDQLEAGLKVRCEVAEKFARSVVNAA
jgi:type I restriction enzyme S subunit